MRSLNSSAARELPLEDLRVSVFTVPTEEVESDGGLTWDKVSVVWVEVEAGGRTGVGYTYADPAAARLIDGLLREALEEADLFEIPRCFETMARAVRNAGRLGVAAAAISAVDTALWDLKARFLNLPLVLLLGRRRESVPIYGSGGFTSYSVAELQRQMAGWTEAGIPRVKMKVGREPAADRERVLAARAAIGEAPELFVDANGAYAPKQALDLAQAFQEAGVTWFEEPVPADDLRALAFVRAQLPPPMELAIGEYANTGRDFMRILEAGAVDVLQADASRCGGVTGFLQAGELAHGFGVELSSHTAPALHLHLAAAVPGFRHLEYFHDHVRIEDLLLEGLPAPVRGQWRPDVSRPGLGIELRTADAQRYAA